MDATYGMMLNTHMMWGLMVLLFILSLVFRNQKITVMILRLSYIVMLVSGAYMLYARGFELVFLLKGLLALVLFGIMEMLVGKTQRGEKQVPILWVIFAVLIILIPAIGYGYIKF